MEDYVKVIGLVLVGVIICLVLSGHGKQFSALLTLATCAMVTIAALAYIRPVLDFFNRLQASGNWNNELFSVLIKVVGIGILSEIVSLICADSGNASMGKTLQFMTVSVILWLSLPLFEGLMELVEQLLGRL